MSLGPVVAQYERYGADFVDELLAEFGLTELEPNRPHYPRSTLLHRTAARLLADRRRLVFRGPPVWECDLDAPVQQEQLAAAVAEALATLKPREREVIELRFGFDQGGEGRTYEAVAQEFGVTRERIRQIEVKALRKLRHPDRSRTLKPFAPWMQGHQPPEPQPRSVADCAFEALHPEEWRLLHPEPQARRRAPAAGTPAPHQPPPRDAAYEAAKAAYYAARTQPSLRGLEERTAAAVAAAWPGATVAEYQEALGRYHAAEQAPAAERWQRILAAGEEAEE